MRIWVLFALWAVVCSLLDMIFSGQINGMYLLGGAGFAFTLWFCEVLS